MNDKEFFKNFKLKKNDDRFKTIIVELIDDGKIILIKFDRPNKLNTMTDQMQDDLNRVFNIFENEPSIWVSIITGNNPDSQRLKSFCAGQDLKEWLVQTKVDQREKLLRNPNGFGSLSRRRLSKPIIAAVDGLCLGGGFELLLNCDLVVATQQSTFGFPEVSKGVIAVQGGIPRLTYLCGRALASELLFTGRSITADEAYNRYRIVNKVVPKSEDLIPSAVELGRMIIKNSPSAVQLSKLSILDTHLRAHRSFLGSDRVDQLRSFRDELGSGIEESTLSIILSDEFKEVFEGHDIIEGLKSFSERRKPIWKDPINKKIGSEKEERFKKFGSSSKL